MKPIKLLPIMLLVASGLVTACSTSKLAQNSNTDDVYNTTAKAKEIEIITPRPQQAQTPQSGYDEYYGTSNPYYDMDYASRINRFYGNGYTWNNYFDPYFYGNGYYGNGYYGNNIYNNSYLGFGLNWSNGYGLGYGYGNYYGSIWNNPFYYGGYNYGYNNWGIYSIYDRYGYGGGYYGGFYGGGFGGGYVVNNPGRPRPGSNDTGAPRNSTVNNTNYGRPSRSSVSPNNGAVSNNGYERPSRTQGYTPSNNGNYSPPPADYSRPTRSSAPSYSPPSNSGSGSGSSGSGSSGGGNGGGGNPSRAGRG